MVLAVDSHTIRDNAARFAAALRSPRSSPRANRRVAAAAVTVLAGASTALCLPQHPELPGRLWLAFFAITVPAIAIVAMLPTFDLGIALIVGAAGAAAVNTMVVEAMLAVDAWSIRGGVAAVGVVAALLWLVPAVPNNKASTTKSGVQ